MKFLLWALGLYLLYRLIFNFIIPVFLTTRRVRKQFKEMQTRMQEQFNQYQNGYTNGTQNGPQQQNTASGTNKPVGDYIEFEEIRD